ncbi:MAG: hypothetical protein HOW73_22955 [Polyangiaceae bacterium]|nr:hypothetical protein [Polyangiaceae bacterium]
MHSLRLATIILPLVVLTAPATVLAQDSEKAAAETLFQSGREAIAQGDAAGACPKFEASQRLDPALGTMLHLADCYERIGKTASAWALFEEAASLAESLGQRPRAKIAKERASALDKKLSRVTFRVPAESRIEGLRIQVESVMLPAESWETSMPLDPGEHVVVATAPGYVEWKQTLSIEPEATQTLEIPSLRVTPTVQPMPAPVIEQPAPPRADVVKDDGRGRLQRIAGIVTGSVGLATLVAGGVLGIQALSANDQSLSECRPDDPTLCNTTGVELRSDAEGFALGSTITFVTGAALVATGVVVFVTAPSSDAEPSKPALAFGASPGGASLRGTW